MTQPSGEPLPSDEWKAVAPSQEAGGAVPPMPGWVKPALVGGVLALALGAGLVGGYLGSPDGALSPSPSVSPSPPWPMEPPVVVGDYVRGQVSNGNETPGPQVAQADYTDGEHTVVLVMTWPEADVADFLTHAGIVDTVETAAGSDRYCGVSEDTGEAGCGEVVDEAGLLLVSVSEQSPEAVSELLDRFKEELGQ